MVLVACCDHDCHSYEPGMVKRIYMHFMVAFVSQEESQATLASAVHLAAATQSKLTLVKVLADPQSLGLVAELIATDEPFLLAKEELQTVVDDLLQNDLDAVAEVRIVTEIGAGIVTAAIDLNVDMVFIGTGKPGGASSFLNGNDPVAHYIVDHCPTSVVLVRQNE
ncbi:MAG: hypothetical protein C0508_00100 [Cyanobacteria bacterium PR.023]|nr:hypothetical protein [Cyanobacteria bacterium PR.023]